MTRKQATWLAAAVIALAAFASTARAADNAAIQILVSVTGTKTVNVSTTSYNFGPLGVNASSVSATAITVTNGSTELVETYQLQGANATGGTTPWILDSSTGTADHYMLAAQFSSGQPADDDASWGSDDLNLTAQMCTATVLGNGTAGESGAGVASGANRSLWFRIQTPTTASDSAQHDASLTLSVY